MSNPPNPQPFVREYDPERDNLQQIFSQVHAGNYPFESVWWCSYWIFCLSYLKISPETCFVADSGEGTIVGFLVGTLDTKDFAAAWKRDFLPTIADELSQLPTLPDKKAFSPEVWVRQYQQFAAWKEIARTYDQLVTRDLEPILEKYPAHYHIGVSPEFRKQGLGRQLVERFATKVREQDCPGIHLTVPDPEECERFHERMGFVRSALDLNDGETEEMRVTSRKGLLGRRMVFVRDLV